MPPAFVASIPARHSCAAPAALTAPRRPAAAPRRGAVRVVAAVEKQTQTKTETKTFSKRLNEAMWDFFQGSRERKWAPDRRPEGERGPFDIATSTLSWGRYPTEFTDRPEPETAWQPAEGDVSTVGNVTVVLTESDLRAAADEGVLAMIDRAAATCELPIDEEERTTTGRELAELVFAKYDYYFDCTILQSTAMPSRQVHFNIYGAYLGSRIFGYTESQYIQKMDGLAAQLNAWDQAWFVKKFLRAPVYPRRGLPSRPKSDTAVTLRLNTSPTWKYLPAEAVDAWFTYN
mmetsp:Transcript_17356/g.44296  ORF Transcript_17356/g.44296 Transcript_17356/m.44296 type:complete len:289 (+) Transcript_17356:929-1795(+)